MASICLVSRSGFWKSTIARLKSLTVTTSNKSPDCFLNFYAIWLLKTAKLMRVVLCFWTTLQSGIKCNWLGNKRWLSFSRCNESSVNTSGATVAEILRFAWYNFGQRGSVTLQNWFKTRFAVVATTYWFVSALYKSSCTSCIASNA